MTQSRDYRKYLEGQFEVINKKLDSIESHVQKTNNRVNNLESWKDEFEGGRKAKKALLTTIWTIVVIISGLIAIASFIKGNNNKEQIQVIDSKLRDKQDKKPDTTVRAGGFGFKPITEDTAYIKGLQREYERLMK